MRGLDKISIRVITIALLMTFSSCKQGDDPAQDQTVTTAQAVTNATAEQTETTTEATKDPAEEVPFGDLKEGEEMLDFRYEYIMKGEDLYVVRYGIFTTTAPGFINGTGLYVEFLDGNLKYVSSQRYGGVGFIALQLEPSKDESTGMEGTFCTVPTFCLATYDGATVSAESKRLYYMGDSVSVLDFFNTVQFPLNKYGERNFFNFLSHAPEDLGKAKGARILAYQDGTKAVLVDPKGAPVIDDALIASVESLTMKDMADLLGLEDKG